MSAVLQGMYEPTRSVLHSHVQNVRMFLRDFVALNQLTRGEESSDRMIVWATMDFISDFNQTPPFSHYNLDDLVVGYGAQNLATRGTTLSLIQSLMFLYNRNQLSFSDGGLSVGVNDKAPMLMSMIQWLQSIYEQNKRQIKTAINVNSILDGGPSGVHSDYMGLESLGLFG